MYPGSSNAAKSRLQKNSLVREVGRRTGIRQKDVRAVINNTLQVIEETCRIEDGRVVLHGFGTFERRRRSGRSYRHPVSGDWFTSEPSIYMYFTPSTSLTFT